jgi:hypothetical protein
MKILGLDYGGVIIREKEPNVEYVREYMPEACRVIKRLKDELFDDVFIVSRIHEGGNLRALAWMDEHDFWGQTGVKKENYRYCYNRDEKAGICEDLDITDFIDNRLEVLSYMDKKMVRICLHPTGTDLEKFLEPNKQLPLTQRIIVMETWKQIEHFYFQSVAEYDMLYPAW